LETIIKKWLGNRPSEGKLARGKKLEIKGGKNQDLERIPSRKTQRKNSLPLRQMASPNGKKKKRKEYPRENNGKKFPRTIPTSEEGWWSSSARGPSCPLRKRRQTGGSRSDLDISSTA